MLPLPRGPMKHRFPSLALALCILLAAGFLAGCGREQPTEHPTPTRVAKPSPRPPAAASPQRGPHRSAATGKPPDSPHPLAGAAQARTAAFADMISGREHACGLLEDGSAACWSYDGAGRASPRKVRPSRLSAPGGITLAGCGRMARRCAGAMTMMIGQARRSGILSRPSAVGQAILPGG